MIYDLAYNLGITVHDLLEEMGYEEFLGWQNYFEQRPVGWREDFRTARLMNAFGVDKSPKDLFPSVAAIFKPKSDNPMENNFKGSALFSMLLTAKGGDKLELGNE